MEKERYNLGVVSVSFRQHTPKEILEAVKAAGLSCVEWGSDVHAPYNDEARLHEIAALQKQYGIHCSSYGTYFRLGETPIELLPKYIEAACILGTGVLRLWCGGKSGTDMSEEERETLFSLCRQAAAIAKERRVTLCMECHKSTFTENPFDAAYLMQAVSSPFFRMYWQPFQWQSAEKNLENAKTIAEFAEHIHVFNWTEEKRLPLDGAITEWRHYLRVLPPPRTLLLEFMPNGSIEELKAEASTLKKIVGDIK